MFCVAKGDTGKRVIEVMGHRGLKAKDLVEYSLRHGRPITYSRISNWARGDNDPKPDLLGMLAKFTRSSMEELTGETPISNKRKKGPVRGQPEGEVKVPKLQPIKAGEDWTDPFGSDETMLIPSFMWAENVFTCTVDGDSMHDFLQDDDTAVFVAEKAIIGMVVVARNEKGEMTIKQFKHSGTEYLLHPLNINPKYKDLRAESWTVEGYLVGIIRVENGNRKILHNPHGLYPTK